ALLGAIPAGVAEGGNRAAPTLGAVDAPRYDHTRADRRDAQGSRLSMPGVPRCAGWRLRVRPVRRGAAASRREAVAAHPQMAFAQEPPRQLRYCTPPRLR